MSYIGIVVLMTIVWMAKFRVLFNEEESKDPEAYIWAGVYSILLGVIWPISVPLLLGSVLGRQLQKYQDRKAAAGEP